MEKRKRDPIVLDSKPGHIELARALPVG